MTNRDKFLEILKDHGIYDDDVEEILYAVTDMLNEQADKMEAAEPHAWVSGKPLKHRVFEHSCGVYDDFQYAAEDGRTYRYKLPEGILDGLRYTLKDILWLVNRLSKDEYTSVVVMD